MADRAWDYIIVGSGSAGATLAARLSERPDRRVLLLEAGGGDLRAIIRVPGLVEQAIGSRRLNWHHVGDPDPSLGGRCLTWAAGRVLGGSSSINGMVYGRGLPADYAAWVAAGNPGWGWDDMLPAFRKLERWTGAPHPDRGDAGPVCVRPFLETEPACRAVMDAFIRAGVPYVDDYSLGIAEGIGLTQATQQGGARHSAARAYLRPARSRPNLMVLTGARADRLLLDGTTCTGLVYRRRGRTHVAHAAREVIVAAGALGTPKLLLLSGIGAREAIAPHGIAPSHDLPGVGRGLNDHVNIKLSAFVETPTYNSRRRGAAALRAGIAFAAHGQGPASSPANHCQAFVRTDPALPSADVQVQLMPFGFGSPAQMRRDGITAVVSACRPEARGTVGLRSADPAAPPRIAMSMLGEPGDVAVLLKGCRMTHAMLRDGAGRRFGGRIYAPEATDPDDDDWRTFFRETAALNWHPTSTCRMAPRAGGGVVDATLRVHGLRGLSIADASVMPSVTSANTNIPVIAIAERAAGFILARTA
jgi:choline dehydrogenase